MRCNCYFQKSKLRLNIAVDENNPTNQIRTNENEWKSEILVRIITIVKFSKIEVKCRTITIIQVKKNFRKTDAICFLKERNLKQNQKFFFSFF